MDCVPATKEKTVRKQDVAEHQCPRISDKTFTTHSAAILHDKLRDSFALESLECSTSAINNVQIFAGIASEQFEDLTYSLLSSGLQHASQSSLSRTFGGGIVLMSSESRQQARGRVEQAFLVSRFCHVVAERELNGCKTFE